MHQISSSIAKILQIAVEFSFRGQGLVAVFLPKDGRAERAVLIASGDSFEFFVHQVAAGSCRGCAAG